MKPSELWDDGRTEREFEECGLQCCTRTNDLGHRCGYVALPKGHPLFGKDWDACYDIAPELEVDGGITFANGTDDMWVLGWDAAHAWHRRDWSIASDTLRKRAEEHPELYVDFDWPGGSYMVDADMAEHETRRFARQLADGFYDFNHECDAMPEGVSFLKINGSCSSQFAICQSEKGVGLQQTTLYGFRFCPYCGEDMEGEGE